MVIMSKIMQFNHPYKLRGNSTRKRRRCRSRSEGVASTCFSDSSLQQDVNHVDPHLQRAPPPLGGARETSGREVKELIHAIKFVNSPKKVTKYTFNKLRNIYIYLKKQNSTNKEAHD